MAIARMKYVVPIYISYLANPITWLQRSFKTQWQEQSIPKMRLRTQAYPDTRGRPFIGAP